MLPDVLVKENKVTNTCVAIPHTQMYTQFLNSALNSRFSQLCLLPEASLCSPLIPIPGHPHCHLRAHRPQCPLSRSWDILGHFSSTCWNGKYQGQGWGIPLSPQSLLGSSRAQQNINLTWAKKWGTHCKIKQTTLHFFLFDPIESSTQHRRASEKQICLINQTAVCLLKKKKIAYCWNNFQSSKKIL